MKSCIVISTPEAKFSALAVRDNVYANIRRMAGMGFDGVEIAIRDPKLLAADEVARIAAEANIEIPAIGTGQAYGEEGLSFTDPDPEVREAALRRIREHITFASKLKAKVILGLIRGSVPGEVGREEVLGWLMGALEICSMEAKKHSVELVIEPINRYETNLINTVDEALEVLKQLDRKGFSGVCGLLLDTFHMNIEEPSIRDSIIKAGDRIRHVHIADSNRWPPGYGHLDFDHIYRALNEIGYEGYISAECLPRPSSDEAVSAVVKHMKRELKKFN